MLPYLSIKNITDISLTDIKFVCQGLLAKFFGSIEALNLINLIFRKFTGAIGRAFKIIISAFGIHISRIIHFSSNKKMIWVNASWIIAFMKNAKTFWNWPDMNLITKSMSYNGSIIEPKLAMAEVSCATSPIPTCFSFINVAHESIYRHVSFLTESVAYSNILS